MSADAQVITPEVTARIAGTTVSISRVVMTLQVGGMSTCAVSTNAGPPGKDAQVIDTLAAEIAKEIGERQQAIFTPRNEPDCLITIKDGNPGATGEGGTIRFNGYLSNPAYSNVVGNVGSTYTVVHESAILSAFRGYIYGSSSLWRELVTKGWSWSKVTGTNPAKRLRQVIDNVVEKWSQNKELQEISFFGRETMAAQHLENVRILRLLAPVFESSEIEFPEIGALDKTQPAQVSQWLSEVVVLQRGSSFFQNLNAFEQAFQAVLIPLFSGSPAMAKFISQQDVLDNANPLYIAAIDVQYGGGSRNMLPLSNVVIMNKSEPTYREPVQNPQPNVLATELYAYPETPVTGGGILYDNGPPWLKYADLSRRTDFTQGALTVSEEKLSIDDYGKERVAANKLTADMKNNAYFPIIKRWAKNLYKASALAGSQASLVIPLTVAMVPGSRYDVHNLAGQRLFSGFLTQVMHRVELASGRPQASTALSFSHITAGDFKLPNS